MDNISLDIKYENLKTYLRNLKSAVVAFSSGVDSTFLLKIAHDELKNNVIALSLKLNSFPKRELDGAIDFCKKEKIKHIIVEINELDIEGFKFNPINRCYLCKRELFKKIWEIAKENNIQYVLEGSNIDDSKDYRPGMKAVEELGVLSPLKENCFTKNEIRILSKKLNLKTAAKPSLACLSSRFAYGEEITLEKINMVDRAEQLLFDLNFRQFRVRIHSNIARIEVLEDEYEKLIKSRKEITDYFKKIGFKYITMDLEGYRTGSMNEMLIV